MYAIRYYENPSCVSIEDFHEDCQRFKWVSRLLNRYYTKGELKERLILNHIIVLYNVFEPIAATRMMFFKIKKEHHSALKTFLLFLSKIPDNKYNDITIDINITNKLKEI